MIDPQRPNSFNMIIMRPAMLLLATSLLFPGCAGRSGVKRASDLSLLKLPTVRQATDYTCGAAAFQSILGYYGEDYREDTLAKELQTTTEEGTRHEKIVEIARSKGFEAYASTGATLEDLKRLMDEKKPVIVAIQAWADNPTEYSKDWADGHYVAAIGYDAKNIYFMDPSTLGNYTYIPTDEFLVRWHDESEGTPLVHLMIVIHKKAPPKYNPDAILHID